MTTVGAWIRPSTSLAKLSPSSSFNDTQKPDSFHDRIKENNDLGLHIFVLLDIKVKGQSEEGFVSCAGCLAKVY